MVHFSKFLTVRTRMDKIVREKATVSQSINQSSINQGLIPTCCSRWLPLTGSPVSDIHFQSCPFPDSWNFLMILSDKSRHNFIFRNINLFSSAYPIQGVLKHYCEIVPQFVEIVLCRLVHLCSSLLFKSASFPMHSFLYLIMLLIFWQSTQLVAKCSSRCYISSLSCPLPAFLWWVIAIKSNYNYYYYYNNFS